MTSDSNPSQLRRSFWLLAFTPAVSAMAGSGLVAWHVTGMDALGGIIAVSAVCGVGLNLICSAIAGFRYAKWNKPATWRAGHVLGYALLFFAMNLLLLPVGFPIGAWIAKAIK